MRLSVVFKEKRDVFFLIKQFHLIEKNQQKNKHRLLLENFYFFVWKDHKRSASPSPATFFNSLIWSRDLCHRQQRGRRMRREGTHQHNYTFFFFFFFWKRHRNSLRIWPGNPMNASGDIKRTLSTQCFSELAWQDHVGPDSICCFVTLAFCHFKWLRIILHLHVHWLFLFNLFQLIYCIDF